ncbi:ABC transporter ATP-binding protein [Mesorhizobium sp. 1M-11]|uniref:ABC transporter ATP-binding protein n=1 Tax=Mesorhizobium sp. 1M-11 TaxID=1529006 RepID=UPI0006C739C8|nr:ABC transporter ATP-binding protein [Mesorhizobium sp. 1M-11]
MAVLKVEDLSVQFRTAQGVVRAVDRVSFEIRAGETLAVVGESGSGKSVTALAIMRLLPRHGSTRVSGRVMLGERDLVGLADAEMQRVRGNQISMVFQEPMTSLNPLMRIGEQIEEGIRRHQNVSAAVSRRRAVELLDQVRIADPHRRVDEFPHTLSGGMRQRVMIAMALACEPKLLIADEPTTALDVTVQAQILELLATLRKTMNMSMLLITHDLSIVADTAERTLVMYAGRIVEAAATGEILARPAHPYTRGLLGSLPKPRAAGRSRDRLTEIPGAVPPLHALPAGCSFAERCQRADAVCRTDRPEARTVTHDRLAVCHFAVAEAI